MDSMEQRLRSLIERGFRTEVTADLIMFGEHKGKVQFEVRLAVRTAGYGDPHISVSDKGFSLDEAASRVLAAAEAYARPVVLQAAE